MDKISIIVPVYNNYDYLDKCIKSLLNQTYKNIEIILINDGSTDNSLSILKKYASKDKRIVLIDKKNEGVSKARNVGIKKSTGKYITFCDSDDYLELDAIETIYYTLINNKADVVRSNYKVHYSNSNKIDIGDLSLIGNSKYNNDEIRNEIIPRILDGNLPCFVYLLLINKKIIMEDNIYFREDIKMMEDVVFYLDILSKTGNLYIIEKITYNIQFNTNGATNNKKNYERNINDVIKVNNYIKKILHKEKLDNLDNIVMLNTANSKAISDFIFKQYLYGDDAINLCKKLYCNNNFIDIVDNSDKNKINKQRYIILKLVKNKQINSLKLFFKFRKILRKLKNDLS